MKKVQWQVAGGDILDADTSMTSEPLDVPEEQDAFMDALQVQYSEKTEIPLDIITHTGDVLYIGQEDDISGRRFIKFVVKDTDGLVWSLLPQQIRYI